MADGRDLLITAVLLLAAVLVTFDAWYSIFHLGAANEELSYVLLAPVIIGWLAWARRRQLRRTHVRGGWVGLLILGFGWFLYSYGFVADPVLWRAGAVLVAVGAVVAGLGCEVLMRLRFAPAFLAAVFLIPISPNGRYRLAVPLQNATAQATQTICDLLGMHVDRAGHLLTINGVDVNVAEACNGMRMILTLFMVCYVVAFTLPLKNHLRVLLLAASPLVAVVANVIRLVPTVWLFGNVSSYAAERFHDVSGWVMTVLAFLVLMGFFRLLEQLTDSVMNEQPPKRPVTIGTPKPPSPAKPVASAAPVATEGGVR
jgi:exosortase